MQAQAIKKFSLPAGEAKSKSLSSSSHFVRLRLPAPPGTTQFVLNCVHERTSRGAEDHDHALSATKDLDISVGSDVFVLRRGKSSDADLEVRARNER